MICLSSVKSTPDIVLAFHAFPLKDLEIHKEKIDVAKQEEEADSTGAKAGKTEPSSKVPKLKRNKNWEKEDETALTKSPKQKKQEEEAQLPKQPRKVTQLPKQQEKLKEAKKATKSPKKQEAKKLMQ